MTESTAVPESVMDSARRTLANVEQVEAHLPEFLSLSDLEVNFHLSNGLSLFSCLPRPPPHSSLERLSLYHDKLEQFIDLSEAPLRPSTHLNYQAAARFVEHSLPDLTPGQRQSMKDISKREGARINYLEKTVQNKRKHRSSEKQSVQTAAHEFLEKAACELFW